MAIWHSDRRCSLASSMRERIEDRCDAVLWRQGSLSGKELESQACSPPTPELSPVKCCCRTPCPPPPSPSKTPECVLLTGTRSRLHSSCLVSQERTPARI